MSSLNKEEEQRRGKKVEKRRGKRKRNKEEEKGDLLAVEGDTGESEKEAGKAASKGQFHLQRKSFTCKEGKVSKWMESE